MASKEKVGYPSDVSDEEWAFVLPYLLLSREDSAHREHDLRAVFNGVRYIARTGNQWRFMPHDYPPWPAIYQQMQRWMRAGCFERLVEDTEGEVRRLLDYCGLPFEAGCLRFYENDRAVRTASSEQVRRPIFKDAVEHWRAYEPWLEPLKAALGPVLHTYPEPPAPGG